jgi:hypothetical protein
LSPDDNRVGSYDPLVWQARGEEQLAPARRAGETWLWIGLGLGLVIGPGEALLLLLCRRRPVVPVTTLGGALALGCGLALLLEPEEIPDQSIELIIETGEGVVARSRLSTRPPDAAASWLSGSSADPLSAVAGELSLGQRQDGFEPDVPLRTLSAQPPRVRSLMLEEDTPRLLVSGRIADRTAQVQSADEGSWDAAIVLGSDALAVLPMAPQAGEAVRLATQVASFASSDDPATVRAETPLEALAAQRDWEPILMDRHLGLRLVKRFEAEAVSAIVARRTLGNQRQYVIHLQRE